MENQTIFAFYILITLGVFTEILACIVILYMQLHYFDHFDLGQTNTALVVFLLCSTAIVAADILSLKQTWQY